MGLLDCVPLTSNVPELGLLNPVRPRYVLVPLKTIVQRNDRTSCLPTVTPPLPLMSPLIVKVVSVAAECRSAIGLR